MTKILKIDGLGEVKVDDSFMDLSPDDQQKTVDEIIASAHGSGRPHAPESNPSHTPDYQRIRVNVGKMIDQNAPEKDIDAYLAGEGVTPDQLRAYGAKPSRKQGTDSILEATLKDAFPSAKITGRGRGMDATSAGGCSAIRTSCQSIWRKS